MKLFLFILVIFCILSLVTANQCNCNENLPNVSDCGKLPQCGKRISREPDSCSNLETNQTKIDECNETHFSKNLDNHMGCPNGTLAWPLLHIWNVTYENDIIGGVKRPVYKINGGFPGPTIQAIKGDWILVPVINNITNPELNLTTIHWHGVTMRGVERQTKWNKTENPGTPFMDGVPGINQCAISPNQGRFDYFFQFVDSGTFWYHSHFGTQLADGLSGAMVVKDCKDVNRVKDLNDYNLTYNEVDDWKDTIITVTDWFSNSTAEYEFNTYKYNSGKSKIKLLDNSTWVRYLIPKEPQPDTGLINGNGYGNFTINFVQGKTYRLRLINVSAMSLFYFTIQNHSFEVIEVEGMLARRNINVYKRNFTELPINAGQRYSILVNANQKRGIYGMRFYSIGCQRDPFFEQNITGIIRYDDPVVDQPEFDQPSNDYDCTDLPKDALIPYCDCDNYSLFCKPPPKNDTFSEMKIIIDTSQKGNVSDAQNVIGVLSYMTNDRYYLDHEWSSAKNNTLLGVYKHNVSLYQDVGTRNVFDFSEPKVHDIFFNNLDPLEHPIHLHGHFFYVLGFGLHFAGDFIDYSLNEINPIQRDTVTVPPRGWAQIRVVVDNPGVWPMHCHIDWHLGIGMLAQFVELDASKIKPPVDWLKLCYQLPPTLYSSGHK